MRGIAAVEFALVLPLLIVMYFGTVELTRILDANRKLTLFARTLADLSGRADNPKPSSSDMATIAAPGKAWAASRASLLSIVMRNRPRGSAAPVNSITTFGANREATSATPSYHTVSPVT